MTLQTLLPSSAGSQELQAAQEADETLQPFRDIAIGSREGAFLLCGGVLYRRAKSELPERAVIPISWRNHVLQEFHDR